MTLDEKLAALEDDERFSTPELAEDGDWIIRVTHPNRNSILVDKDFDEVIKKAWRIREEIDRSQR